ncbi:glycoside hydrolase family 20 protein [Linnemannia elongata AG-77]|uniref:Beta-hexosaminidase n=1 Tax=Linnemannia elongata AG-77 TaxID=1314771 RepID=A0A197JNM2_9FUNG|nr:glycoside hydrolase family 20 protein [Linnemannia elongata AG-77]
MLSLSLCLAAAVALTTVTAQAPSDQAFSSSLPIQKIQGIPAVNPVKQPWIWPLPQNWERGSNTVKVSKSIRFEGKGARQPIVSKAIKRYQDLMFKKEDYPMIPYNWSTTDNKPSRSTLSTVVIDIKSNDDHLDIDTDESYTLTVPVNGKAVLQAETVYGALHGLETLSQLVQYYPERKSYYVPNAPWKISDFPKYKHRGILLDTSRHYYTVQEIEKLIDTLSWNKLNVFHWHMLDSTSFPYVSKKYPELAAHGAYTPRHVYTAKDIKHIVQFAKERGVRVIPEMEAPGHSTAWGYGIPEIASCLNAQPYFGYTVQPPAGQLNIAHPKTKEVVYGLIDEWAELFPDSFFHAAGDEVVMKCWENDTYITNHLKNTNQTLMQLFENFVLDMEDHVRQKNKTVMVWQEMLLEYHFNLPKDTVIQVWIGSEGVKEVTSKGYKTIVSAQNFWYLDLGFGRPRSNPYPEVQGAGFNHWNRVYSYDMRANLTKAEADLILGAEATMWGELADPNNVEDRLWPRAAAFAERLWSGYETPKGEALISADAILRLLPWREQLVLRGVRAGPLNQGFCTRNPLDCFQPPNPAK